MGRPRAAAVAARAAELNPGVAASFAVDAPAELAAHRPGVCSGFSLVIAAGLPWPALEALDASLRAAGVPLVAARSFGLAGFVRVSGVEEGEGGSNGGGEVAAAAARARAWGEHTALPLSLCLFPSLPFPLSPFLH